MCRTTLLVSICEESENPKSISWNPIRRGIAWCGFDSNPVRGIGHVYSRTGFHAHEQTHTHIFVGRSIV